ncbi:SUMF1/EgtB/PvdO family nonheme iron enzyme [Fusobacterium animalis]|uniref:SUMF1/EgtB/PvdO family nonheme iron enzyme n=1 Tax=Fusobacterium TaxID=848 RepID=UPI00201A3786|nr:SUMF1/EgtB/PvdO family nonheme iron enzyme [Fusobacterium nucleatum]MCL4575669.1 ATPase AAA [Fusobacterium nucleatum YWH7056]MCL4583342.1 ATPase AAA [Fusobacterium nucleatum YWH7054]MCL4591843.1 ATPase AAA [Fusobacterium nucleatum YWH7053]
METNLIKYLRARRPIIWVNSGDYKEIDTIVKEATKDYQDKAIYEYRAFGAVNFETKVKEENITDLYNFLDTLYSEGIKTNVFLLIKNTEEEMKDAKNIAYIKKIAETRYSSPDYNFTIIVISEAETVPKELEKFTSILDIPNMSKDEIEKYILKFSKDNNIKVDEKDIGEVAISLKGLTKLEIDHVLNMIIESKNNISISGRDIIIKEKGQIIKKSSILEIIDFKEKIEDIGGLEGLKEWLKSKAQVFRRLDEAKKFGVDTPKGVLLVGMPGCGKSLAAKASARLFNVPLLRLDIGRLLGKYVGESEHNMRVALKTAESISPCILWIDEIEKAFAGINQDGGASDITKRLFGQFLTWLQEKENTVFVVATANDITAFPPEFLRKGRFDEVFFIDFPNEEERERIFEIHLEKRGKLTDDIDINKLAKKTEGYCGADIEEVVKNAVENIFILETKNEEEKEITTQDLLDSIKNIDSLTNILADKIKVLKDGYDKFKIKSASEEIILTERIKKNKKTVIFKDMIKINGGKYTPSFFNEEREVFDLEVCKYLVTQDMWTELMEENPSSFEGGRRPIEGISWWDALEYCNKLSEKYNLEPVYDLSKKEEKVLRINQLGGEIEYPNVADFKKTEGFRLPTEVEWEWFARGGEVAIQDGKFYLNQEENGEYKEVENRIIEEESWYCKNSGNQTHDVGTKKPNQLKIYDCIGNVWEWCYDVDSSGYISEETPYIYDASQLDRRLRGGSWNENVENCTYFIRANEKMDSNSNNIGFRIVRTI